MLFADMSLYRSSGNRGNRGIVTGGFLCRSGFFGRSGRFQKTFLAKRSEKFAQEIHQEYHQNQKDVHGNHTHNHEFDTVEQKLQFF